MIRAAAGNKELTRWEVTGWKELGDNGKDGVVVVVERENGAEVKEEPEGDWVVGGMVVGNGTTKEREMWKLTWWK